MLCPHHHHHPPHHHGPPSPLDTAPIQPLGLPAGLMRQKRRLDLFKEVGVGMTRNQDKRREMQKHQCLADKAYYQVFETGLILPEP